MLAFISVLLSGRACRFRSLPELALEIIALCHQLTVLRRQCPGLVCSPRSIVYSIWSGRVLEPHGVGNAGHSGPVAPRSARSA
jgi:hypothetical protein